MKDLTKIEHILRKLNKLVEAISREEDGPSMIERDLFRSYLTQLYDASFADDITPKVDEEPLIIFPEDEYTAPVTEDKVLKKAVDSIKEPANIEQKTIQAVTLEEETIADEEGTEVPESVRDLFKLKEAVEISDRLSSQPVHDISKSLSINGKLVVINQLFGGDDELFRSAVDRINEMGSFDEARDYLIHAVAVTNEWGRDDKSEVAEDFVRLVNRKFQNK